MEEAGVDFAQVKASVSLRRVLEDYGILARLRQSGKDHCRGLCPIHHGEGRDAFHGDLRKNIFHCFSCGAGLTCWTWWHNWSNARCWGSRATVTAAVPGDGIRSSVRPKLPGRDQLVTEKTESNWLLPCLAGLDVPSLCVRTRLELATATHFGIGFYSAGAHHARLAGDPDP
jgi:hypothetical protein